MVKELYNAYLHQVMKYTNKEKPYDKNIGLLVATSSYPYQYDGLLGNLYPISYRDHNELQISEFRRMTDIPERPEDDTEFKPYGEGPEDYEYDENDIYTQPFKVLRADSEAPNVYIGVSKDYKVLVVGKIFLDESTYVIQPTVMEYPAQCKELIGTKCGIEFPDDINDRNRKVESGSIGYIIRADVTEPGKAVIMDVLNNRCRFLLDTEAWFHLKDSNSSDETRNTDQYDEDYTDYKTATEADYNSHNTNDWYLDKHSSSLETSDYEIAEIRKNLLENIDIYYPE